MSNRMQSADTESKQSRLDPDSPCIGYCSTSFGDDVCVGCGRSAEEVVQWIFMGDAQKKEIWTRITVDGTALRFRRS